jgi:hypothetical protein
MVPVRAARNQWIVAAGAVDGTRYEKSDYKILHQSLREDTVEQQREWPAGKRFVVYVESDDPNAISLSPDVRMSPG